MERELPAEADNLAFPVVWPTGSTGDEEDKEPRGKSRGRRFPLLSSLAVLCLLGLTAWQGWMTLTLFGADRPLGRLLDGDPIISGRHPLHLYHGYLGAQSFYDRGTLTCYDPNFQAGYPKTPVFDGGSRPAELFLILAGGSYQPAAYKIGLAIFCLAVPLVFLLAARGVGLGRWTTCLATVLGLLVWWGVPCQESLAEGDLDLLLAALAALALAGFLVGFHRGPTVRAGVGILVAGSLGWFAQPVLFALLGPLILAYYFSVGGRHSLVWHLALLAGLAGAVAANAFWLGDWVSYWWIRSPLQLEAQLLPHRTLRTLWNAPLWGASADRALAMALIALGAAGVWVFNRRRERQTARLFGLGMAGLLMLAVGGVTWEPLGRLDTSRLLAAALLFAAVPAAHALVESGRWLCQASGGPWRVAFLMVGPLLAVGLAGSDYLTTFAARCAGANPLRIGLGPEREALVAALQQATTPEARILWEDCPASRQPDQWTPLLPLLTGRAFLGGLDPHAGIEHAHATLRDEMLAGRPIGDWSDADLEEFCRRYNVGWVVCRTRAAAERFLAWKDARPGIPGPDSASESIPEASDPVRFFTIRRTPSFALKGGRARWLQSGSQYIALGDVVPNADGEVVLSLHYQAGMQVSPSRVKLERELDPYDPIPFVRLQMPGPVVRVTLTWKK